MDWGKWPWKPEKPSSLLQPGWQRQLRDSLSNIRLVRVVGRRYDPAAASDSTASPEQYCEARAALGRKSSERCSLVCYSCRNQDILPAPHRNSRDVFCVPLLPQQVIWFLLSLILSPRILPKVYFSRWLNHWGECLCVLYFYLGAALKIGHNPELTYLQGWRRLRKSLWNPIFYFEPPIDLRYDEWGGSAFVKDAYFGFTHRNIVF